MTETKLYVLTGEPYHDQSEIIGVFSSLEAAQAAVPEPIEPATDKHWHWTGWREGEGHWSAWIADPYPTGNETYEIHELPLRDA